MSKTYATKFQFTPLREGRPSARSGPALVPKFQFTPLREGRLFDAYRARYMEGLFQFTPLREGRPQALAAENQRKIISIHAPA